MNTDNNDPMARPLSPVERMKLVPVCRDLGINMADYTSDRALCEAITKAVLAEVAAEAGIECDACHIVKPESAFADPGHTAGGTSNGYDIDSCVCAECAEETLRQVHKDLAISHGVRSKDSIMARKVSHA